MHVEFQVLKKSRVATYTIEMEPLSLERIDVVEAKMRDLQEAVQFLQENDGHVGIKRNIELEEVQTEVKKLKNDLEASDDKSWRLEEEVKKLSSEQDNCATLQLTATAKVGDWIGWNKYVNGVIVMNLPGLYQVTVVVNYVSTSTSIPMELMKNSERLMSVYCSSSEGYYSSSTLTCITQMKKNDALSVKCPVSLVGTSYMTLIRLGK
ncbi:hypothetical protein DVH05_004395 [Phytophthora capsici]|nr:hypothetical protein DVH05_004395 [Phytophthora capsici]